MTASMTGEGATNPIRGVYAAAKEQPKDFSVRTKGRPERNPREAAMRNLRRLHFGQRLRGLREAAKLTQSQAAKHAGMASPRKLAQYETTCYPPGDIVRRLATAYGVDAADLARMVLSHSDPDMFEAITGMRGYQPVEDDIDAYLKTNDDASSN